MTRVITDETIFDAPTRFNVLPVKLVDVFTNSDTTPSVLNREIFRTPNNSTYTITNFDQGADGQDLFIVGDGKVTVANNSNIKTSTGANKLLATNRCYHFKFIAGIWYEVGP